MDQRRPIPSNGSTGTMIGVVKSNDIRLELGQAQLEDERIFLSLIAVSLSKGSWITYKSNHYIRYPGT